MSQRIQINDQVTVGPQPSADDIASLSTDGFKSIINFRTAGEDDQPISPSEEGERAEAMGLKYCHLPVSMQSFSEDLVDDFRRQFQALPKPVFAHCKSGKRAGAMVMMHTACEQGMTGDQTLEQAKQMGFECDQPELVEFVKSYVDSRNGAQ